MWRILHSVRSGRSLPSVEPSPMTTTTDHTGATSAETLTLPVAASPVQPLDPAAIAAPDFVGLSVQDARRISRLSNLHVLVEADPSHEGPWGRVRSQEPQPGALLAPGDLISLVVGSRPLVVVPDVHGREEAEVVSELQTLGLLRGRRVVRKSDVVPAGCVLRARPRPGSEVPTGTRVSYVVASSPRAHGKRAHEGAKRVRVRRLPDGSFSTDG